MSTPPRPGKRGRTLSILFAMGLVSAPLIVGGLAVYRQSADPAWGMTSSSLPWADGAADGLDVQGNFTVDRADNGWTEFSTAPQSGEFQFTLDPQSLYPGRTVYAPVSLRVAPAHDDSTARITLHGGVVPASSYLFNALRYRVGDAKAADCAAGRLGTPRPGFPGAAGEADALLASSDPLRPVVLPRNSEPVDFCFAVTLPESFANDVAVRGQSTGPVVWNFVAQADQ